MTTVEYEYSTSFEFPYPVQESKDYNATFDVDSSTVFTVKDRHYDRGCTFTLYAKRSTNEPGSYDPTQYEVYAQELKYFYNIVRLALAYITGHIVKGKSPSATNVDPSLLYEPPVISHDFYERAADAGITISPRKGRDSFTVGAYIVHQLTPEKVKIIHSICRHVKREMNCVKYDVLDLYVKGFTDRVDPYLYWYQIVEIVQNPELGFIDTRADSMIVGTATIDLKFLRLYAHTHRHSTYNRNTIKNRGELQTDADRAKYLLSPNAARSHYDCNLRPLVEHFILHY